MSFTPFIHLMRKDLLQFKRIYKTKLVDTCLLFFTNVVVFGYFMPYFGLSAAYGVFILIGAIASFGLFDIIAQAGELMFDIEGDKKITFNLTLPTPYWVIFGQIAVNWAFQTFLVCMPLFLLGKFILWEQFDLSEIHYGRLILIFPTVCLFFGFFSLWLVGIIQKLQSLSSLFFRFINPIFMFGGYFFSWQSSLDLSPYIAYALLINPMIYVMEGMRAATLGQADYLPFWISFFALWGFIFLLGMQAVNRLKKRLDCV